MIEFLQWIGAVGGIGAVFAVLMFLVYRQTTKQMREDRKYWEDRLAKINDRYDETATKNTTVLTELITWLKAKNGSRNG